MPSDTEELLKIRPELKKFGLKPYIGNQMAINVIKGLNGPYARRQQEGIRVATSSPTNQLIDIIRSLINDRRKHGCSDKVEVPTEEGSQRALIIALWTNRPIHLGRNNLWQAGSKPCYGNQSYMPPLNTSQSADARLAETSSVSPCYQPTSEDVERILEEIDPNDDGVAEDELRDQIELDAKKTGKDLCSDWWKNLQTANESTENLG